MTLIRGARNAAAAKVNRNNSPPKISKATSEYDVANYIKYWHQDHFVWVPEWRKWVEPSQQSESLWVASDGPLEIISKYLDAIHGPDHKKLNRVHVAKAVENELRRILKRSAADFDNQPDLLQTEGALFDLKTGNYVDSELEEYSFSNKNTSADFEPADYDEPKQWLKFLKRIQPEQEMQDYLQRVCGYCLTGRVNLRVFFILYGEGANGKSVFANTLHNILGGYAGVSDAKNFARRKVGAEPHLTFLAAMEGKRLVIVNELPDGSYWNGAQIKKLVSTDPFQVNKMRCDPYQIEPTAKLMFLTNHLPSFTRISPAITRRLHLIKFNEVISPDEENPYLEDELKKEYGNILCWMVKGAMQVYKDGRLIQPKQVLESSTVYGNSKEAIAEAYKKIFTVEPGSAVKLLTVVKMVQQRCSSQGLTAERSDIIETIEKEGHTIIRQKNVKHFNNLAIKPDKQ